MHVTIILYILKTKHEIIVQTDLSNVKYGKGFKYTLIIKNISVASEVAQQGRQALATEADDLSSIPGIHMLGKN